MPRHGYDGDIVWIESVFFSSGFRYVVRKVPRSEVSQPDTLGAFNPVEISMLSEYVSILRSDYGYRDEEIEFSFLGYFLFDWCFRESERSGSFLFVLHLYRLKMRNRSLYRWFQNRIRFESVQFWSESVRASRLPHLLVICFSVDCVHSSKGI